MKNKEVLFVSNFLGEGGAARVISVLAEEFANSGNKVTICSYPFKNREEYYHSGQVNYIKFQMKYQSGFLYKVERIMKLRNEIKKHNNATVISFEYFVNMQTIVAMTGLKNRLIISERNDPAKVGGKAPIRQLRNFLYRFADCFVCQTRDALEYFPKAIQKKSVIIMNPLKANLPMPWNGERRKEIVNFCRLEKQKNIPLLIDAFEEFYHLYPEYKLVIYGDGTEQENVENYIKSKQLANVIALHPAVQDIHERVRDAMMFVSSSDYEGLSNSMIEAMAIGLPTICTDCPCGGARMVIKDGVNGLLIPLNNKKQLVMAMCRVVEDADLREKMIHSGKKIRECLSSKIIIKQWQKLI